MESLAWLLSSEWLPFTIAGGALVLLTSAYFLRSKKPFKLNAKYQEKDVIYLFQYPRGTQGPNSSPFCLKLETFVRMHEIPHRVVSTWKRGPKGKMPYIAYNGQVISDSDFIVEFLIREFKLSCDSSLDPVQKATGHAVTQMIEEGTFWTFAYFRWVQDRDRMPYILRRKPSFFFRCIVRYRAAPYAAKHIVAQGMGRHTVEEIAHIVEEDLRSVSVILGGKPFLLGESPTSHDAALFGLLSVALYQCSGSVHHTLMTTELTNLQAYCQRIRDRWFPDWDELCAE